MSATRLKRPVGILVAGVALALAILATLPGMAEAQEEAEAQDTYRTLTQAEQNTPKETGTPAAWRSTTEAPTRLVVRPGDSLWSISQEKIGSGATPQQVAYEVERIFELNRDRIGDDPNLIFPGQELLVEPALKPTAPEEPVAPKELSVSEEPVASEEPAASENPVASAESVTSARMPSLILTLVTLGVLLPLVILPVYAGVAIHRWVVEPAIAMLARSTRTGESKGPSGPARESPENARGPSSPIETEDAGPASAREPTDASLAAGPRQGRLRKIHQRPPRQRRHPTI